MQSQICFVKIEEPKIRQYVRKKFFFMLVFSSIWKLAHSFLSNQRNCNNYFPVMELEGVLCFFIHLLLVPLGYSSLSNTIFITLNSTNKQQQTASTCNMWNIQDCIPSYIHIRRLMYITRNLFLGVTFQKHIYTLYSCLMFPHVLCLAYHFVNDTHKKHTALCVYWGG